MQDTCAVKIAVRERGCGLKDGESVVNYSDECSNILIVDDRSFSFDYVLGPKTTQKTLFEDLIKPLVQKVKLGFNCTALAYGQTGTGKSYTMGLNMNTVEGEHVGVIPRCLKEIFATTRLSNENTERAVVERKVSASFIEIYNEKVYDLFAENSAEPIVARGYKFTGGTRKTLSSIQECYSILMEGTKNRHVRPTKMNSQSSRSHAVFTIHVRSVCGENAISSCLNLVDLAGSEGVRRTGHQGVALSEGVNINQGLLCIGKVLQAMSQGSKLIPYRDSVLSSVLQDSLSPNSYLTLLACISPNRLDLSETLSTLRFAQNAKQIKHTPQVNAILAEIKKNKITPYKAIKMPMIVAPFTNSALKLCNSKTKTKANQHSHTFCTPSKKKRFDNNNKFNKSDVGLTPKEKQKTQMGIIRPMVPIIQSEQLTFELTNNLESVFDNTARSSIMSLNVSSSTAVDAPVTAQSTNYSPIVRRCMSQLENVVNNKLQQIMDTLNAQCSMWALNSVPTTPLPVNMHHNDNQSVQQLLPNSIRQELKSMMQEVISNNIAQNAKPNTNKEKASTTPIKSNVACQLFATSSPVFKVPEMPEVTKNTRRNILKDHESIGFHSNSALLRHNNEESDDSIQFLEMSTSYAEPTVMSKNVRRSRRISQMNSSKMNSSSAADESHISINDTKRRRNISKRTSMTSIKQLNDNRRRSVRLAAHLEVEEPKPKSNMKPQRKINNNSVIASYCNSTVVPTQKTNLTKHRKGILQLLNTGSMKELQLLPQVGQKTAYQLVTQRTLNGKFKSLAHVEKLPIWRGTAWERFAKANILQ